MGLLCALRHKVVDYTDHLRISQRNQGARMVEDRPEFRLRSLALDKIIDYRNLMGTRLAEFGITLIPKPQSCAYRLPCNQGVTREIAQILKQPILATGRTGRSLARKPRTALLQFRLQNPKDICPASTPQRGSPIMMAPLF